MLWYKCCIQITHTTPKKECTGSFYTYPSCLLSIQSAYSYTPGDFFCSAPISSGVMSALDRDTALKCITHNCGIVLNSIWDDIPEIGFHGPTVTLYAESPEECIVQTESNQTTLKGKAVVAMLRLCKPTIDAILEEKRPFIPIFDLDMFPSITIYLGPTDIPGLVITEAENLMATKNMNIDTTTFIGTYVSIHKKRGDPIVFQIE